MTLKNDDNSLFLKQLEQRMPQFRRNGDLERLLEELAGYLAPVEDEIEKNFSRPARPPLFLVGNPRSGTSVFMQFLASSGAFSIPTNLLSRFYYAPFLGAKIQELLTNPAYDYKKELTVDDSAAGLASDIGKTKGSLAPSEFFHFWRRFLPRYDPEYLDESDCEKIDMAGLQKGVAAIESVFAKPFAAKAIIVQYNLDVLFQGFPNSLIVHIRRDPAYVMQSILQARERFYGDRALWWSVKPKEYGLLKEMDFYHQIAGQVYYTERALAEQMLEIPEPNKLVVDYEDFCADPQSVAHAINEKYAGLGYGLNMPIDRIRTLEPKNTVRIEAEAMRQLEKAYAAFEALQPAR
jgi:hypothetical protein